MSVCVFLLHRNAFFTTLSEITWDPKTQPINNIYLFVFIIISFVSYIFNLIAIYFILVHATFHPRPTGFIPVISGTQRFVRTTGLWWVGVKMWYEIWAL